MTLRKRFLPVLIACGLSVIFLKAAFGGEDPAAQEGKAKSSPPQEEAARQAPPQVGAAGTPQSYRAGVADMRDVFRRYSKAVRYDLEVERRELKLMKERARMEEEIKGIEAEIQELEPGSRERTDLLSKRSSMKVELRFHLKKQADKLKKLVFDYTNEVESDIRNAAATVAERRGLKIVLNFDPMPDEEDDDLLRRRIPFVLYAHRSVNITEEVLAELQAREGKAALGGKGEASPEGNPTGEGAPGGSKK